MNYIVEIIKAVAWPVTVLTLFLIFFSKFRGAFDYFLRNIRTVRFPGGSVETQNTSTSSGEAPREDKQGDITLTEEQTEYLEGYIKNLQNEHSLAHKEKQDLQTQLANAYVYTYAWKFEYLKLFYVPNTKNVLFWFTNNSPQTRESYHKFWQFSIPLINERNIILDVLVRYGMIESDGVNYKITEQGYSFLQYVGSIPYAPKSGIV
ncbi:MAG: hypothetical protein ABH872_00250 [Candidatus Omnitrophota bacterium]